MRLLDFGDLAFKKNSNQNIHIGCPEYGMVSSNGFLCTYYPVLKLERRIAID